LFSKGDKAKAQLLDKDKIRGHCGKWVGARLRRKSSSAIILIDFFRILGLLPV